MRVTAKLSVAGQRAPEAESRARSAQDRSTGSNLQVLAGHIGERAVAFEARGIPVHALDIAAEQALQRVFRIQRDADAEMPFLRGRGVEIVLVTEVHHEDDN